MTGSTETVEISVVVPAYNSGTVIEATTARIAARFEGASAEIIVVENGSTDDTFDRCIRIREQWNWPGVTFQVLRSDKGMGNALRVGALASRGEIVLFTADDLPFGFDDLDGANRLAADLGGIPTVVIGSKAHKDSSVHRGALRGVLTWGFALMRRVVLGMRTGDPQGTVLIDGDLVRRLAPDLVEPGFLFTTELVHAVEGMGIRPVEVPVRLSADHGSHDTRISRSDVVSMGAGLFRLRRGHRANRGISLTGANGQD